jgi:Leucine-rich repeat (LRR) protein
LKILYLASNRFEEFIPNDLYRLTTLEEVDLSYNDFTGTLSPNIGSLTYLKRFFCDGTKLTGQIPAEIGNLANLVEFSAAENEFTGTLPTTWNALTNLETLALQQVTGNGAGIGGSLLSFENFGQLTTLKLASNNLTGSLPSNLLVNSRHLQKNILIGLSDNELQGTIPSSWSRFEQLSVDLTGNKITGISSSLCSKLGWMEGTVSKFQCDAILCPLGTYNVIGRKTDDIFPCLSCPGSTSMGTKFCDEEGTKDVSSEINILHDIYSRTGGTNWENNAGWDNSNDYCNEFFWSQM